VLQLPHRPRPPAGTFSPAGEHVLERRLQRRVSLRWSSNARRSPPPPPVHQDGPYCSRARSLPLSRPAGHHQPARQPRPLASAPGEAIPSCRAGSVDASGPFGTPIRAGNDPERRPPLSGSCPCRSREATRGHTRKQRAGPPDIPFSERVPVRGVTWLDPRLVAEVTYGNVTPAGVLRAPVFRGFATTTSPSVLSQSG
jgi:hypothetical protein